VKLILNCLPALSRFLNPSCLNSLDGNPLLSDINCEGSEPGAGTPLYGGRCSESLAFPAVGPEDMRKGCSLSNSD
jgi:hypothetical protein